VTPTEVGWRNLIDYLRGNASPRLAALRLHTWVHQQIAQREEDPAYWPTPEDVFEAGETDCVGLTLLKYASFRMLGYDADRLRICETKNPAHMRLRVFVGAGSVLLDNLQPDGLVNGDDIVHPFEYNESHLWVMGSILTSEMARNFESWLVRTAEIPGLGHLQPEIGGH